MTDSEIGAEMGRTERAITNKRHQMRLRHYRRDTRPPNPDDRIAKRTDLLMDCLDTCRLIARQERCHGIETAIDDCFAKLEEI